jgi:uncharacterized surface protein with fasciclin (FAS1) repeats
MQKTQTTETKILDLVSNEPRFTRFNEAINAAGLTDRFASPNKFTVFAPTNEAFGKLTQNKSLDLLKPENREHLRKLLLLHIVPGALMPEDLSKATTFKTEAGQAIKVSVSSDLKDIKVADAKVMLPRVAATNGVIYPLDTVLQNTIVAGTAA